MKMVVVLLLLLFIIIIIITIIIIIIKSTNIKTLKLQVGTNFGMSKTPATSSLASTLNPPIFLQIPSFFFRWVKFSRCAWQHLSKVNLSSQHHLEAIVPSQHFFPAAVPSTPSKHSERGTNSAPTKGPKSRYRRKANRDMKLENPIQNNLRFNSPEKIHGHLEGNPGFPKPPFFLPIREVTQIQHQFLRLWDLFMLLCKPVS